MRSRNHKTALVTSRVSIWAHITNVYRALGVSAYDSTDDAKRVGKQSRMGTVGQLGGIGDI
jgi:hypothetical protein